MARKPSRPSLLGALARLGAAAALGYAARGRLADADEQARKLVYGRRSDILDKTTPALTDLGSVYAVGGAAAVLAASGRARAARDVAASALLAWGIAQGAKRVFRRARPFAVDEDLKLFVRTPAGESYPSGHPAVAAAIARALEDDLRAPARGLVQRIPKFVAFSRVYVGAHYPSDVVGGLLIGRAIADLWKRYSR
jgi:undecaprenyl-diphosphatase